MTTVEIHSKPNGFSDKTRLLKILNDVKDTKALNLVNQYPAKRRVKYESEEIRTMLLHNVVISDLGSIAERTIVDNHLSFKVTFDNNVYGCAIFTIDDCDITYDTINSTLQLPVFLFNQMFAKFQSGEFNTATFFEMCIKYFHSSI